MKQIFVFILVSFCSLGMFLVSSGRAQAQACTYNGKSGACIPASSTCNSGISGPDPDACESSLGQVCCTSVTSTNACTSNCGTSGTCSCVEDTSCTSPKTTVSAGNAYCATQLTDGVCCKTLSSGGSGSGSAGEKCDSTKFEEYAGVCFPKNTGLSELSITDIAVNLMKWMLYLFGFLAIISFVVSGIQYLAASGNAPMIETAKRNMTYSIVGVIVALAGLVIITAIDALLKGTAWGG